MKFRFIVYTIIIGLLYSLSCTKLIEQPVEDCNFNEVTAGDAHPYSDLFQEVLDDFIASGAPGVSVAIYMPEYGWWVGCAGVARIEDQTPMKPCHVFHSASVAKPYTATMIMKLVQEGLIGLDDPIENYLPEDMISKIANADVATIRQLLSHTSGIYDLTYFAQERVDLINDPDLKMSVESRFEKYLYGRPAFGPAGECFHYSNAGMDLLGMIIEEASGESIGDYFQREIIESVGLTHTYYKSSPGYPEIPNLANGYIEQYPGQMQNWSHVDIALAEASMGHVGVIATPYEFARFYRELINGNILDSSTLEKMLKVEWKAEMGPDMCLGIYHRVLQYGGFYMHGGRGYGVRANARYYPEHDVALSIQTNVGDIFEQEKNEERFINMRDRLLDVIFSGPGK